MRKESVKLSISKIPWYIEFAHKIINNGLKSIIRWWYTFILTEIIVICTHITFYNHASSVLLYLTKRKKEFIFSQAFHTLVLHSKIFLGTRVLYLRALLLKNEKKKYKMHVTKQKHGSLKTLNKEGIDALSICVSRVVGFTTHSNVYHLRK